MSNFDFDVTVIGGGGAGMAAAIEADEAGATVLLVEGSDHFGGATAWSGGVVHAAGTALQREAGCPDDSPDQLFRDYMLLNHWQLVPGLVRTLCDRSASVIEWLQELGVEFRAEDLYRAGTEETLRGHRAIDKGEGLARALEREVRRRGIDLALGNRVDGLVVEDGRVVGCTANGEAVRSRSTVLATGGFGSNRELLAKWCPSLSAAGEGLSYIGPTTAAGDGLIMAEGVGAHIAGFDRALNTLSPGFWPNDNSGHPGWMLWVNEDGRRVANEAFPYAVSPVVVKPHGGHVWAVFDEASRLQAASPPSWVPDVLASQAENGTVRRAGTLDELALDMGVNAQALTNTVKRYNDACAAGVDTDFEKQPEFLRSVSSPPFYAAELRLDVLSLTSVGPEIDVSARVLDEVGRPVDGLYAAGEVCGGVMGEVDVGGGNTLLHCMVFGRIAGTEAARFALGEPAT